MTRGCQRRRSRVRKYMVSRAQAREEVPGSLPPRTGCSAHAARGPLLAKPLTSQQPARGEGAAPGRSARSSRAAARGPWEGGLGAGPRGAKPRGSGRGIPPGARAGAKGRPGRYLLLDLSVLGDNPVRGGEGTSSRYTQQSGKTEKPAWARARRQVAPAADPYCRRHLDPPRPRNSHRKRKRLAAARHLVQVGAEEGGAEGALPADKLRPQPRFGAVSSVLSSGASALETAVWLLFSCKEMHSKRGNRKGRKAVD